MATWQFDLHLVPASTVAMAFKVTPITITQYQFDDVNWWRGVALSNETKSAFSKLLPPATSWSSDIETWGDEEGNRVDFLFDNSELADIFVRIDVRNVSFAFVIGLIQLARENDWLFLTQDRHFLRPFFDELMGAIKRSDSFRFVENPEHFLRTLEKMRSRDN